jgi:4-hydroxy-3-methylbut-2-en-1-yl diphosphate synthase IspG/GcpE
MAAPEQIHFVEQQHGGFADDVGMLGCFVVAAGGAEHADLQVLAEVEPDGADQVADVFDEEEIEVSMSMRDIACMT